MGDGAKLVYLIGAGANRAYADIEGDQPPLIDEVFSSASRLGFLKHEGRNGASNELVDFVDSQFHVDERNLTKTRVSVEEVMDHILDSWEKALAQKDAKEVQLCQLLWSQVTRTIGCVLQRAAFNANWCDSLKALGVLLWAEKPTILTFNYDTILEDAIEKASGPSTLRYRPPVLAPGFGSAVDAKLHGEVVGSETHDGIPLRVWTPYLNYGWNPDFASGTLFGGLRRCSAWSPFAGAVRSAVEGPRMLKLHGSLNWFRFTGEPKIAPSSVVSAPPTETFEGKTLFMDYAWMPYDWPSCEAIQLEPLVVTPNKLKEKATQLPPYDTLWEQAARALTDCRKLVVIGYSFGDDHCRKYFDEHSNRENIEELVFVSPSTRAMEKWAPWLAPKARVFHLQHAVEYIWRHPLIRERGLIPFD